MSKFLIILQLFKKRRHSLKFLEKNGGKIRVIAPCLTRDTCSNLLHKAKTSLLLILKKDLSLQLAFLIIGNNLHSTLETKDYQVRLKEDHLHRKILILLLMEVKPNFISQYRITILTI